jgi:hypothetical protein
MIEDKSLNSLYKAVENFRLIIKERKLVELDEWIKKAL